MNLPNLDLPTREEVEGLKAQVEQLKHYIVALTHADETGYVDDIGFVENFAEVQDEVSAIVAEVRAQAIEDAVAYGKKKSKEDGFFTIAPEHLQEYANQIRQQAKDVEL